LKVEISLNLKEIGSMLWLAVGTLFENIFFCRHLVVTSFINGDFKVVGAATDQLDGPLLLD
jgi:hypothetical protein